MYTDFTIYFKIYLQIINDLQLKMKILVKVFKIVTQANGKIRLEYGSSLTQVLVLCEGRK